MKYLLPCTFNILNIDPMLVIMVLIASIVFIYFFTRWVLDIKKRNDNQQKQIQLLSKVAEKLGVEQNEIFDIVNRKG